MSRTVAVIFLVSPPVIATVGELSEIVRDLVVSVTTRNAFDALCPPAVAVTVAVPTVFPAKAREITPDASVQPVAVPVLYPFAETANVTRTPLIRFPLASLTVAVS